MNHKIGEQWVEEIDGKEHMVKLVPSIHLCRGCVFLFSNKTFCSDPMMSERNIDCSKTIIKDLGILNEDGCLPEERTGKYPTIKDRNEYEGWRLLHIWDCTVCEKMGNDDEAIEIRVSALTRQEAIDRWNWRA